MIQELNVSDIHLKYERKDEVKLNSYGGLVYCKFSVPSNDLSVRKGLYAFYENDELIYIGRTNDSFLTRVNAGYGNISPKNCYIGGQSTNCKMNSYINAAVSNGSDIKFYVYPMDHTEEINSLEAELIKKMNPPLNGQVPSYKVKRSNESKVKSIKKSASRLTSHLPGILSGNGSLTDQVEEYIRKKLKEEFEKGNEELTISAKQIHTELGFSQRYPIVSTAMDRVFTYGDEVAYNPPKGKGARKTFIYKNANHSK